MTLINEAPLVNMKHRYVATTACPIGTPECDSAPVPLHTYSNEHEVACIKVLRNVDPDAVGRGPKGR